MSNVLSFFKKKHSEKSPSPSASQFSSPRISQPPVIEFGYQFDSTLLPRLHADHVSLLDMYANIGKAFESAKYNLLRERVAAFRRALQSHILLENVKLYGYLSGRLGRDTVSSEIIAEFREEMTKIGRVAMGFLRKYSEAVIDERSALTFKEQYTTIGAALLDRIKREEAALYPLYSEI